MVVLNLKIELRYSGRSLRDRTKNGTVLISLIVVEVPIIGYNFVDRPNEKHFLKINTY